MEKQNRLKQEGKVASPARLQMVANSVPAVTRCTRGLRFAWVSNQWVEWIRRPAEKIAGEKIQDVLGTEAFLRLLPYFERVLSGETLTHEDKIAYSSIGERWISATYTPTFDSQGKVDGWVAVIRDITDQRATESALLEKEKQLAEETQTLAKLNACSQRLWQVNCLKEGLGEMLRAVVELQGADKGNVQILEHGRSALTIAAQQGFEQEFLDYFREVSAKDDSACGRALRRHEQVVIEDIEKDGGFAPHRQIAKAAGFRAVVSSPLVASNGKVLGMLSVHFTSVHQPSNQELRRLELCSRQAADFIQRCHWEEELRVREERYRTLSQRLDAEVHAHTADLRIKAAELSEKAALLDLAKDAIFVKSANGTISYWNEGATTLYGWTMSEALGRSPAELLHSQYPIPLSDIESRDDWEGEICHTKRDGSRIIVVSRWTKIQDPKGGLAGWLEINTDITARKRAEESTRKLAARLLQMQDQERRRIARELHDSSGQTIAALIMNIDQLKKTDEVDGERAYLLSQAETLLQNLNKEIRTISHLLHPPLLDAVGLSSALQWYVDGFEQRSGIVTSLELSPDFGRVNPDLEIAIFRVVQECLTNVHRHSGSSKAVVRLKRFEDVLSLEVQDEGKGVAPEKKSLLLGFGPVGVGLRGMRERALELGGTLEIESDDGGTTIRAMFPIAKSALHSAEEVA